ncbi:MAG: hypothetical protein ACLP9C_03125 [Acidimicrobiales bacterium]
MALAIAEGAHSKSIQSRMSHSSISITLDGHDYLLPELGESIAASFGKRSDAARQDPRSTLVHAWFGSI